VDENALSNKTIGAAIAAHRELGPGLLESIYEAALALELQDAGLTVVGQTEVPVSDKGRRLQNPSRLDLLAG